MQNLSVLTNLTQLVLPVNSSRSIWISQLTNLKILDPGNVGLTEEEDIESFSTLTNLEKLSSTNRCLDGKVPVLASFPNLKILDLPNIAMTQITMQELFSFLESHPLFKLHLGCGPYSKYVWPSVFKINVIKLHLTSFFINKNAIQSFIQSPFLESLTFEHSDFESDLPEFASLTQLKQLKLHECDFKNNIATIESLTNLQSLTLYCEEENLCLSKLENLEHLTLKLRLFCKRIDPPFMLVGLSSHLKSLHLNDFQSHHFNGLNMINMTNLERLSFWNCEISDSQLTYDFPKLKHLSIGNVPNLTSGICPWIQQLANRHPAKLFRFYRTYVHEGFQDFPFTNITISRSFIIGDKKD